MKRRVRLVALVAGFFVIMMCGGGGGGTSQGCGSGSPTSPGPMSAAIVGTVSHSVTNAPINGATVTVTPPGMSPAIFVTGANGTYSIGAFNPGTLQITARAAGYQDFSSQVTVSAGQNTFNIRMTPL